MDVIKISDVPTDKFLYDPKSDSFQDDLERDIPEFFSWQKEIGNKLDVISFMYYLVLMYDMASPYNRAFQGTDFMTRKYKAAISAGFKVDKEGHLRNEVMEAYLAGKNEYMAEITIKYINKLGNPAWTEMISYMSIMDNNMRIVIQGYEKDIDKQVQRVSELIKEKQSILLNTGGEEESQTFIKKLYKEVTKDKDRLTPENRNKYVADKTIDDKIDNPYGDYGNPLDEMKFIGDE